MGTTTKETLTRAHVPTEETWDLTDLFATDQSWEEELQALETEVEKVTRFAGQLVESAATLYQGLVAYDEFRARLMCMTTYAHLNQSGDGTDPAHQTKAARAGAAAANFNARLSFISSEILQLSHDELTQFFKEEPRLEEFQKMLTDLLASREHKLAPETEEVLAAFGDLQQSPFMIYERSKSSDLTFPSFQTADQTEYPLTFNTFESFEASADTEMRHKAYNTFYDTLNQYKHTYAATFATEVKKQVTEAKLRGHDSVTSFLLYDQEVSEDMYHRQLDTILTELAPHMRRLAKLKQRVLGLDEMHYADLKVPLDPDFSPAVSYDEAASYIENALEIMGEEYMSIIKEGLYNRWVDRANNVGKRSGAFCSSPYGVHPYILMTWNGSMGDTFTLAHELGHAAHFRLAGKNQRLANVRPSRYFIEAPSTMNEMLLSRHILDQSNDPRMRRWVVLQSLGTYYHNFVTHILEGELQRRIYAYADRGTPVTAELLCNEKQDVLQTFWGDEVNVDARAGLTWMRQPHYYMGLYPYTYSAGLTASTAASRHIIEEGEPAVERWLNSLRAGGTMKPLDLMQLSGVDMTTKEPIQEAVAYVGSLVDELEASFADE
ncbi:oligopeptidase F [Salsuginibacillus halophilus]|uniref:Oligopeptidase F n=1 Tax=Salsuginibacillus halophilus TaxID=517424 RepID=A0A2P8HLG7_9BACI|nr:oligoendopeptidase F [Salsuginibacillus halophilus]PSL47059.1 oligopeptidase F [Salsuginibacillus halophilus]